MRRASSDAQSTSRQEPVRAPPKRSVPHSWNRRSGARLWHSRSSQTFISARTCFAQASYTALSAGIDDPLVLGRSQLLAKAVVDDHQVGIGAPTILGREGSDLFSALRIEQDFFRCLHRGSYDPDRVTRQASPGTLDVP